MPLPRGEEEVGGARQGGATAPDVILVLFFSYIIIKIISVRHIQYTQPEATAGQGLSNTFTCIIRSC